MIVDLNIKTSFKTLQVLIPGSIPICYLILMKNSFNILLCLASLARKKKMYPFAFATARQRLFAFSFRHVRSTNP